MKRDLINAGIESLVIRDEEYRDHSNKLHDLADKATTTLKEILHLDKRQGGGDRAIVQALVQSGYINEGDRCFGTEQLINTIYAMKMHAAIGAFQALFARLKEMGMDGKSRNTMFNSSGDNYYSFQQYIVQPDEDDILVRKISRKAIEKKGGTAKDEDFAKVTRDVIIMEKQAPIYAAVLSHCIFTGEPKQFTLAKLKHTYDSKSFQKKAETLEFNIDDDFDWSPNANVDNRYGIIASLDIRDMDLKTLLEPRALEHALFNIYSGRDSLSELNLTTTDKPSSRL